MTDLDRTFDVLRRAIERLESWKVDDPQSFLVGEEVVSKEDVLDLIESVKADAVKGPDGGGTTRLG